MPKNFNPRSRVGSDVRFGQVAQELYISIHAPAWGATAGRGPSTPTTKISIHAPAWGATCSTLGAVSNSEISIHAPAWGATPGRAGGDHQNRFQSTLPRGERPVGVLHHLHGVGISIHAPAWGATRRQHHLRRPHGNFNPRSRVGSDSLTSVPALIPTPYFNPRSRVGSDVEGYISKEYVKISIHAPAWGATGPAV